MVGGQKKKKQETDEEEEEEEDEETAVSIRSAYNLNLDIWDNEDKESVANSQAPLHSSNKSKCGGGGASEEEEEEQWRSARGTWSGQFDFLLSLLGYSVGLGNVWRFPYLCYSNGGGAFLLPFCAMLLLAGLPLLFMELALGQYAALGPTALFEAFCPLASGLGVGMVVVSAVVMLYYNLIIAWTLYYLVASFTLELPWAECRPPWSSPSCFSFTQAHHCARILEGAMISNAANNTTNLSLPLHNLSYHYCLHHNPDTPRKPPAEDYFEREVLGLSWGIDETGGVRWPLVLSLGAAWGIVFACLSRGVRSSGKVVYFTALFPYAVLLALFVRGLSLPGALDGLLFYLRPDWARLASARVWGDAAVQTFFALSPAWGGLVTLASYNHFHNNCYRDALIVSISNILTSFFAGLVIFAAIGFLAHELQVGVATVVDQGAGLAFIVIPEVVARLMAAPLWSLLFFLMLLTLGLDSQFALMETVTTAILDRFPTLREHSTLVVFVVSLLGYVGGFIFTTNSGMYWLQLADQYAANWSVLLIAICECLLVSWSYGADRFLADVQEMLGAKSPVWRAFWGFMWRFATPATLIFILVFNWVEYSPARFGKYVYPLWANVVGWALAALPIAIIIAMAIRRICQQEGSFLKRVRFLLEPGDSWGPSSSRQMAPGQPPGRPPPANWSSPTLEALQRLIRGGAYVNGIEVVVETRINTKPITKSAHKSETNI